MQLNTTGQPWDALMQAMSLHPSPTEPQATYEQPAPRVHPHLAKALTGCNHARAALLREIETPCYRYCLALLSNPDSARDATQETALRVLRSLPKYRGDAAFTTWALSIALNVCREHRRRRRWLPLPERWAKTDPTPGPQTQAHQSEQSQRLVRSMEQLPQRQREAVTLRYLQGLSTKEAAQAMRCADGTVKASLAKALATLRRQWGQDDE